MLTNADIVQHLALPHLRWHSHSQTGLRLLYHWCTISLYVAMVTFADTFITPPEFLYPG